MEFTFQLRLRSRTDRSYRIIIRPGILQQVPSLLPRPVPRVFIITDSNVGPLYGRGLLRDLSKEGVETCLLDVPAGEHSKSPRVVLALQTQLLRYGIQRSDLIVALGGGVVGDVAGYVAATVLRGVRYVQLPTTLLAQVDSSVGGKVGIDHPLGKNLIGAFHQPSAVYVDPNVLSTLPIAEYRNGLAEVVKVAAALDHRFFADMEEKVTKIAARSPRAVFDLIRRSIVLKGTVVMKDEKETALRKILNLGHTIGHAVEAASGYRLRHGEAVAIGLAAESRIAVDMGVMAKKDCGRLVDLLKRLRLPVRVPPDTNQGKFFAALAADKKGEAGRAKFVLLRRIGQPVVGVEVPSPFLRTLFS